MVLFPDLGLAGRFDRIRLNDLMPLGEGEDGVQVVDVIGDGRTGQADLLRLPEVTPAAES